MTKKILITGGCGFIGTNFVNHITTHNPEYDITVLDKLTYASNPTKANLVIGDICDFSLIDSLLKTHDHIINFAAETHVDNSISSSYNFIQTNIVGTHTLLECARKNDIKLFIQISTDEVYGSNPGDPFTESAPLTPTNPYSASKAAADHLVHAYNKTYGLPTIITRSSNNFGPYQHHEKLIPKLIKNALEDKPLPIYGQGIQIRDWLHVFDNCDAINLLLHRGKIGEIYNICAKNEYSNLEIAQLILKYLVKSQSLIEFVPDRPGHDFRYSVDSGKLKNIGWEPENDFKQNLYRTIEWYRKKFNK